MSLIKLAVPYKSQWDPDAKDHHADCGPTSLSMLLAALGDAISPDQLYRYIGERGVKLSGGQQQRLAIARAILASPQILILDEATSSLDTESEQLIQASMATLLAGRTTFVIAHRLSTIRRAHLILLMEEGRIIERGTHEQLMGTRGTYYDMVQRQMASHDPSDMNVLP